MEWGGVCRRRERASSRVMRRSILPIGMAALVAAAASALPSPGRADDFSTCREAKAEEAIAACTHAITSGAWRGLDLAATYYSRCRAYNEKGDAAHAIADCSNALKGNPHFRHPYMIYVERANAYRAKGDLAHAIADYNEAIRLEPLYAQAYNNRGRAYEMKGDLPRAIADYGEAIGLDREGAAAYGNRGRAYLYRGDLAKALADVERAAELGPASVENALWVDIVRQRSRLPSTLSQSISKIDMTAWPAPLIRLYLGQMTTAAVFAAADDLDATRKRGRTCLADFYAGELALRTRAKEEALRLLRLAQTGCLHETAAWSAANAELKAIGTEH
jgi:tetratricopeptide (TPR) repeat protein